MRLELTHLQPDSLSVPYCQQAPRNAELNGLFQCQFEGANLNQFVGNIAVGQPGTIPFGQNAAVNPLGSCPAHTSGPITAGAQLDSIVSSPGVPSGSSAGNGNGNQPSPSPAPSSAPPAAAASAAASSAPPAAPTSAAASSAAGSGSAAGFKAQNGKDAQALNQQFQTLTADSSCTSKFLI